MPKHTPGPWEYAPAPPHKGYSVSSPCCGAVIATLVLGHTINRGGGIEIAPGSAEANARLMAESPGLLDCLREIVDVVGCDDVPPESLIERAKSAIARANGE